MSSTQALSLLSLSPLLRALNIFFLIFLLLLLVFVVLLSGINRAACDVRHLQLAIKKRTEATAASGRPNGRPNGRHNAKDRNSPGAADCFGLFDFSVSTCSHIRPSFAESG